jgi:hypothetical protein
MFLFTCMLFWQVDWMSSIPICFSWVILTSWLNVLNSHLFFLMLFWQVDWMSSIHICFSWCYFDKLTECPQFPSVSLELFWQVDWMSSIHICFSWCYFDKLTECPQFTSVFLELFWQVDWMSSIHICFSWVILTSWLNVLNSHLFFLSYCDKLTECPQFPSVFLELFWQVDWMSSIPICFSWVILTSWLNVLNFNYDYFMWLFKFVVGGWTRWWHHNTNPGYRV